MRTLQKIIWFINRLSVMSWREVVYRLKEQQHLYWLHLIYIVNNKQKDLSRYANALSTSQYRIPVYQWKDIPNDDSEKYLNGCLSVFGKPWSPSTANRWHTYPEHGGYWPTVFFNSIKYKHSDSAGDIRIAWESSRLQHLIALALIATKHQDMVAVNAIRRDIDSWRDANRYLEGIHYISSMECALRVIAIAISVDMVREFVDKNDKLWLSVVSIMIEHGEFISGRLSLYSSLGNHTVAETAGLICISLFVPEYHKSCQWLQRALTIFTNEMDRQIDASGFGIEQSTCYQILVMDLAVFIEHLLCHHQILIPDKLAKAIERGGRELHIIKKMTGAIPTIGDSDSSYAISPYFSELCQGINEKPLLTHYSNSSLTIVSAVLEKNIALTFNHGALGMSPSYGHGHADALSVSLFIEGEELFLDVGTYAYSISEKHRHYFRGTTAHNTVCVNNCDQAEQKGPFMWSSPYVCQNNIQQRWQDKLIVAVANHSGYHRFGISHHRAVIVCQNKGILVRDYLKSCTQKNYHLALNWHYRGTFEHRKNNVFQSNTTGLWFRFIGGQITSHCGDTQSLKGWSSAEYGKLTPITTFTVKTSIRQSATFTSIFSFKRNITNEQGWDKEIDYAEEVMRTYQQ